MAGRLISKIAICAALAAPLCAAAPQSAPSLEIAVEDAAAVWSRPDGTGLANDVVRAAFHASGIEVKLRVVPYARCKRSVLSGDVVACFSMSRDPSLNGAVLFPAMPIFVCYAELIQNPARPLRAARLQDLPRGTVIGTVLGYEYPEALNAAVKSGAIVLDEAPSEEHLMRKLAAGRLAGAVVNVNESKPLAFLSAVSHVPNTMMRVERIGTLPSFLGFSVKHPKGAWALEKYESGMRAIAGNGVLAAITRRWTESAAAFVRAAGPPRAPRAP